MIKFHCSGCNQKVNAPDNYAGKRVRCAKCKQVLIVPSVGEEPLEEVSSVIKFRCPGCNQKIGAPVKFAGKRVKCAKCKQVMRVPELDKETEEMAAKNSMAGEDDIFGGQNLSDNLLDAKPHAAAAEELRLRAPEPKPVLIGHEAHESKEDFGEESEEGGLSLGAKIGLSLGASFGLTLLGAVLWTVIVYFVGLSWLTFLAVPVAALAGYGLTLFIESRNAALGLLAVLIGLVGIISGKYFIAKWVILPKMGDAFSTVSEEFYKRTLTEEEINERMSNSHGVFRAACFQLAEEGEFDEEFAAKVVQTNYDGRAPLGEAEQVKAGIKKVNMAIEGWSEDEKRAAIKAQFERDKEAMQKFGREIVEAVAKAEDEEVPEGVRQTAKETSAVIEGKKSLSETKIGFAFAFIGSFSLLDLLWFPMGLWSAYKIGAGRD